MSGEPLDSWVSPSSKLMILGDAAHAMLPYMSEGAAMAVEDGAALAVALGRITSPKQIPFALRVFEQERVKRTGMVSSSSIHDQSLCLNKRDFSIRDIYYERSSSAMEV